jgi:ABC-type polysaccharide/polyol phosphate transport system ATPase subunit
MVLVSHSLSSVKDLCREVLWLNKGKVMGHGACEHVIENYLKFIKEGQEAKTR